MSAQQQSSNNPEVNNLRGRVQMIEEDNVFVNEGNGLLREANEMLITDNADRRIGRREAELARRTNFWRAAETQLTEMITENDDLHELRAAESGAASNEQTSS
ncbi:hypothetical protein ACKLNR_011605 [Fusarium oxysporum f. sp. zingiberi]